MKKRITACLLSVAVISGCVLSGCGQTDQDSEGMASLEPTEPVEESADPAVEETETPGSAGGEAVDGLPKVDMTKWQYESKDDVYWQVGIAYCEMPKDEAHESMGFYVPGAYFDAVDNGDGTFTCTVNTEATVGGYTAQTAPVIVPVDTPGYMAMRAPSGYSSFGYGSIRDYTDAGFVLAVAGARGRESGAPAGVTDFKAAIRYARYNADVLPGNMDAVFTEGMSGGGAQSSIIGSTGNSALYDPYLEEIGAVQGFSDAVLGSMAWCPITNLDEADAAYEWNMGVTRYGLSDEQQKISDALAESYVEYINGLGLQDKDGNVLTLESSPAGIAQAGSYYDYILSEIEISLNHFLEDTVFPYTPASKGMGMMMGRPNGNGAQDNINRTEGTAGITLSGTYETVQDYMEALNANGIWVTYDAAENTARVTGVSDYVTALKQASKRLGAFDQLDNGQGENVLFGYGDGKGAHFDRTLGSILDRLGFEEGDAYAADFAREDSVGNTVDIRVNMYTPLYYLLPTQEGYQTSDVAPYWRIRTGINQGDTALCTEVNLALALENYEDVRSVDFAMVWGQAHTEAERTGGSVENFIEWVNLCMNSATY